MTYGESIKRVLNRRPVEPGEARRSCAAYERMGGDKGSYPCKTAQDSQNGVQMTKKKRKMMQMPMTQFVRFSMDVMGADGIEVKYPFGWVSAPHLVNLDQSQSAWNT